MHTFRTERSRALAVVALALVATMAYPVTPALADATDTPTTVAVTISSIAPTNGTVAGGTVVTITGKGLTGTAAVAFGSTPATKFTVVSDKTVTAIAPVLAAGTYAISVTTATSTATGATFTVRTLEDEVLRLVNEARASKRKCGSTTYKAAPALRTNKTLANVAAAHSRDMAVHDYFSHNSRNGDSPFDRMKAAGYRYSSAGENIAAGYRTPASVVSAWLKSTGHCKNIMNKSYTQIGVGYATGGYYGTYWTQDFGRPR